MVIHFPDFEMTQPKLAGILFCLTRGKEHQSSDESPEFEIFLGIGAENELIKFRRFCLTQGIK